MRNIGKNQIEVLRATTKFDAEWYLRIYPDVRILGMDPFEHYLWLGSRLGRKPCENSESSPNISAPVAQPVEIAASAEEPRPNGLNSVSRLRGTQALLKGFIDGQQNDRLICGWVADVADPAPRQIMIKADGVELTRVVADIYRSDLERAGVHRGRHGFRVKPPKSLCDGAPHLIEVIDMVSGKIIASKKKAFFKLVNFSDFDGFLKASMLDPELYAPFGEVEKRVLATMEVIGKFLCRCADEQPKRPLVSFIMPAFNRANLIEAAINSVLAQTYSNVELIIVDDASTDKTVEAVERFDDKRIRLIRLTLNVGAASARNEALAVARGDIIAYLDTDNTILPDYAKMLVGAFSYLASADAVYFAQALYQGGEEVPFAIRFGAFNRSLLVNRNYIDLNAFAHRAHVMKIAKFDTSLRRAQDWDLVARIAEVAKIYSMPAIGSNYTIARASNTITGDLTSLGYVGKVRERISSRAIARHAIKSNLDRPVAVLIPNFEALDDLKACVAAIKAAHSSDEVQLIIVDNASSQNVRDYISRLGRDGIAKVVLNAQNFGFTHAVNQGIALAEPGRDIVLLNNDAIVTAAALPEMQKVVLRDRRVAVVVPQQLLPGGTKTAEQHVPFADGRHGVDVNLSVVHDNILRVPCFHDGELLELSFAPFFCAYLKREPLDQLGGLEAEFGRHYRSDRLYCNAVRNLLNLKVMYTPFALVHHKLQVATDTLRSQDGEGLQVMLHQNKWPQDLASALGFRQAAWDT